MNTTQHNTRLNRKVSTPLTITEELYQVQLKDGSSLTVKYTKEVYAGRYDERMAKVTWPTVSNTPETCDHLPHVVRELIMQMNCDSLHDETCAIKTYSSDAGGRVSWMRVILDHGFSEIEFRPRETK